MRQIIVLIFVVTLSSCASSAQRSAGERVGWNWLVQYSYLKPAKNGDFDRILVEMHDDGSIQYIRPEPFGENTAWRRELNKTPKEVEDIKLQIETILKELQDNPGASKTANRTLDAGIIVRTAEELVEAWGEDKYGDPRPQVRQVFKNWKDLDDEAHQRIQKVLQRFNDEAEALQWKWG